MANTIAESLNISDGELIEYIEPQAPKSLKSKHELEIENNSTSDYTLARTNIRGLIETGTEIIPELAKLATLSESARVYEVLTASIKNLADMNKTLLEITKQQLENDAITSKSQNPQITGDTNATTNNYLHVGSTEDLLKMIRDTK